MKEIIERITHAAVLTAEHGWPIMGKCHADCFTKGAASGFEMSPRALEQGFITSKGRFVTRADGYHVAFEAGQIDKKNGNTQMILVSELLWRKKDGGRFKYDHVKGFYE